MTKQEIWLQNSREALAGWMLVPSQRVELENWTTETFCGTLHCFGGWLPHMPYFKALGVTTHEDGAPAYQGSDIGAWAAMKLLGDSRLVKCRMVDEMGSDWEVVKARLERHITQLENQLEPT